MPRDLMKCFLSRCYLILVLAVDAIASSPLSDISTWDYGRAYLSSPLMKANDTINNYQFIILETLEALNRTKRLWNRERIQQSLPVHSPSQMQPLAHKLREGKPIHVLALGSSITNQHGGCWPTHTPCYTEPGRLISSTVPYQEERLGWLRSFMTLLNHTFPAKHTLDNGASSGQSIHGYTLTCIEELINEPKSRVDLVIIEHLPFLEPTRPSVPTAFPTVTYLEQLLHKLWLTLKHHPLPAILVLNMQSIAASDGSQLVTEQNKKKCIKDARLCSSLCQGSFENLPVRGIEDMEGEKGTYEVARRYGFSAFSQTFFLRGLIRDQIHLKYGLSLCQLFALLYSDWVHPSLTGRLFLADLLMEVVVSGLELSPRLGQPSLQLLPTLDPSTSLHSDMLCFHSSPRVPRGVKKSIKYLNVLKEEGWEYRVEGQGQRSRPGMIASTPGSKLWLSLPLQTFDPEPQGSSLDPFLPRITSQNFSFSTRRFSIALTYLASWQHMGRAQVRCLLGMFTGGCNCTNAPRVVDAHISDRISVPKVIEFAAIAPSRARQCILEVIVLPGTSSGENKFKVIKLSLSGIRNISSSLAKLQADLPWHGSKEGLVNPVERKTSN